MKTLPPEVTKIEVAAIRPFIRRARKKEGFEQLVASIKRHGLKVPIEVRDITEEPATERRRPEGGHYKYELVKAEVEAGATLEAVAQRFVVTAGYAQKLMRILAKTAGGIEKEVAAMGINDAEVLTALPEKHQSIVVEVLRENPERQVRDIVRKAEQVAEDGKELSATAVRHSLRRVDDELKSLRDSLKPVRLHHSLGPQNLQTLLADKKFRAAIEKAGVNVRRFQEVTSES